MVFVMSDIDLSVSVFCRALMWRYPGTLKRTSQPQSTPKDKRESPRNLEETSGNTEKTESA